MECHRASVERQENDARHIEVDQRREDLTVEALAGGRYETGAVRAPLPAERV
jgi:hypothetical protein